MGFKWFLNGFFKWFLNGRTIFKWFLNGFLNGLSLRHSSWRHVLVIYIHLRKKNETMIEMCTALTLTQTPGLTQQKHTQLATYQQ